MDPFAKMMNFGGDSSTSSPAPKRRQTMAEMLRESPLIGNTVPMVDAVESAQAAAARKAEGESAPAAIPDPTPAPAATADPTAAIIAASDAAPRNGANRYNLYARVGGKWVWQCDIDAPTHCEGMRQVIAWLKPEHEALPIRLEQDAALATA